MTRDRSRRSILPSSFFPLLTLNGLGQSIPPFTIGFIDNAAIKKMDCAIGLPDEALVVCDHDDCRSGTVKTGENLHHGFAVGGIQIAGRLVGQKDPRPADHRTRDGHPLLLST